MSVAVVGPELERALACFDGLNVVERAFVRGRIASAPFGAVLERVQGPRVVDVGCGHGALLALLHTRHPDWELLGIDVDARKVRWAKASVAMQPNVRVEAIAVEALAAREPKAFDAVTLGHVLYLLPQEAKVPFLTACASLLKPGGRLLLLDQEGDGSLRALKALAQEYVTVKLLRRTVSSGAIAFSSRRHLEGFLTQAGLVITEVVSLAAGYTTPHVLFVATSV